MTFAGFFSLPYNRLRRAQRLRRGIALLILDLGARSGWVVSTTLRPLYPRKRPGTHCTGGWVGHRAGLDVCEKSRPYRDIFAVSIWIFLNSKLYSIFLLR
jgi:hypothetical protein